MIVNQLNNSWIEFRLGNDHSTDYTWLRSIWLFFDSSKLTCAVHLDNREEGKPLMEAPTILQEAARMAVGSIFVLDEVAIP